MLLDSIPVPSWSERNLHRHTRPFTRFAADFRCPAKRLSSLANARQAEVPISYSVNVKANSPILDLYAEYRVIVNEVHQYSVTLAVATSVGKQFLYNAEHRPGQT